MAGARRQVPSLRLAQRPLPQINEDFNGEIFKPHLSETIKIDSDVLARIIERLYPPKSPYRFDVIGVELLGSIYERYLGKTIRPTAKTVRVEEKPEVRKAGGVYYTPKYIVDYIVKNTVGKVIEGKTPKQIEKIRILDPACGSGSFLIGAFQYLIDYHVRYLTAHPKEAHIHPLFPDLIRDGNPSADGPRLSVRLKARILRHNLYGVDIDPQAVEITMMSLYLKALEGEKSQLPPKQSLLPELKYNIICGNSLIGPDIYDQGTLFADEERDRINAFDWCADYGVRELAPAFEGGGKPPHSKPAVIDSALAERGRRYSPGPVTIPQIMHAGGFDCVIGNPPWVMAGYYLDRTKLRYLRRAYRPIIVRMIDSFMFFVAKACASVRQRGHVGMIVPDVMLYQVDNLQIERASIVRKVPTGTCSELRRSGFRRRVTRPSCIFVAQFGNPSGNQILVSDVSALNEEGKTETLLEHKGSHVSPDKTSGYLFSSWKANPSQWN